MAFLDSLLPYLREFNFASTALRLFLAVLFGGLVGLEREQKRRPAGFRTYMLVCLGAAATMLLSQYLDLLLSTRWAGVAAQVGARVDVTRIGAKVINGVGFLGAGTILVTGHQEVKGLITAAGLWASACMGLAIGAGFYECMLAGFLFIFSSVKFFPSIERVFLSRSRNLNLYLEFEGAQDVGLILAKVKAMGLQVYDVDPDYGREGPGPHATLSLRLPKGMNHTQVTAALSELACIHTLDAI